MHFMFDHTYHTLLVCKGFLCASRCQIHFQKPMETEISILHLMYLCMHCMHVLYLVPRSEKYYRVKKGFSKEVSNLRLYMCHLSKQIMGKFSNTQNI